jgi:hypothetical protein
MADGSLPSDFDRNQGGECSIRNKMPTMAFTLYKNGWGNVSFLPSSTVSHGNFGMQPIKMTNRIAINTIPTITFI